jgi:hypothetical protein
LQAYTTYFAQRDRYPSDFGRRLLELVQSLPPSTRRLKIRFPLLSMADCLQLGRCAKEADHDDVPLLWEATAGKSYRRTCTAPPTPPQGGAATGSTALDVILTEIDAGTLATKIGKPIDAARACYRMEAITVDSAEEFSDAITALFLHLLRHTRAVVSIVNEHAIAGGALALLGRAFARRGGENAARAEARDGFHGGLRLVLDLMTDQYKFEEQAKHVSQVFDQALDPLDWNAKVALVKTLLQRIGPLLPADLQAEPPERFAKNMQALVHAYVSSLDHVTEFLRSL